MPRTLASAASSRTTSVDHRLELAEFLSTSDDVGECAQFAVEWLARNARLDHVLCAAASSNMKQLVAVAGFGISPSRLGRFSIDIADPQHPLMAMLAGGRPISLNGEGPPHPWRTVFGKGHVLPLPLPLHERAPESWAGLLLTSPVTDGEDVLWCARLLGSKLVHQRSRKLLAEAEQRLATERALLHSIINAVSDPILLTDAEGKLVIANGRAETLFAATEQESEGRHRAVALNNMLFSAALAQRSIEAPEAARQEILLVDPAEGSDLLFELLSAPVAGRREGTRLVSILKNVTDLRRATQEIEANYLRLKQAEAEVRAERDRLDLVIDSVVDPILVTDPVGNIILMNAPAERLFTLPSGKKNRGAQRVLRANDAHFSSFMSNLFIAGQELRWRGDMSLSDPRTGAPMPFEAIAARFSPSTARSSAS
jgi:PAS domain S-box-containing protein